MGRPEQRKRQRKRSAASCQTVDAFLPSSKQKKNDNKATPASSESQTVVSEQSSLKSLPVSRSDNQEPLQGVVAGTGCAAIGVSSTERPSETESSSHTDKIVQVPTSGVSSSASLVIDIGSIVSEYKTEEEFVARLKSLSTAEKYTVLKSYSRPLSTFEFPKTHTGGCNRSFKPEWLDQFHWLGYSTKLDGAFCVPCVVFNGSSGNKVFGGLVTRPFRTWQKKSQKFGKHNQSQYH